MRYRKRETRRYVPWYKIKKQKCLFYNLRATEINVYEQHFVNNIFYDC